MTIPTNIKLYLDLAAAAILALAVGWFVHHERTIGRQEIQNADAKLVAATARINSDAEALAAARQQTSVAAYKSALGAPVDHPLSVRVCNRPSAGSSPAANDGTPGSVDNGGAGLSSGVGQKGPGADIGPVTEQLLNDASAQVKALQDYIRSCQQEGVCRP